MGLDAFVRCNCYREGKTKPLPFPEARLYIDEDGYWDLHEEGLSEEEAEEWYQRLLEWEREC